MANKVFIECDVEKRTIYFTGNVNEESQFEIIKAINEINSKDEEEAEELKKEAETKNKRSVKVTYEVEPIHFHINSYGGSVYDCFSIIESINNSKAPIYTYCTGKAMSAGFDIFIHGKKRYVGKKATLMYHDVSSCAWGKVQELEDDLEESKRISKERVEFTVLKTSITKEQLEECNKMKKDWYIPAEEAIKLKCADAYIGEVEKDK